VLFFRLLNMAITSFLNHFFFVVSGDIAICSG
jgi:hypothetical protein